MMESRALVTIALTVLAGWLVYQLAPILTPFLLGALLAYIFNPLVSRIAALRLPRVLAVVIVFALIVLVVGMLFAVLVPAIGRQVEGFLVRLPAYLAWFEASLLPQLQKWIGVSLVTDTESLRQAVADHWRELALWAQKALAGITRSGFGVVGTLVNIVLVPVVTFYLLLDWEQVLAAARRLLPRAAAPRITALARETDMVLASFLRGQLTVMSALAVFYSAGLWLTGLHLALPIGFVAGLVSFVPYLGFLTGIVAALVAAYVQFQGPEMLVWVAAVFVSGQVLEGMVLTPRLVGSRIGLHPVAVIFAVMAGGQLFGFLGVLIALPAAAVLRVWLAHLPEFYAPVRPARRPRRRT